MPPSGNPAKSKVLNRRPEARGFRIEQLLQEAADGCLRVPQFQRPLRWRSKQVIEYFDSIRRGFPVGDLLLSRDSGPADTLRFGPYTIEASARQDALWVIDGQQRITALVACLLRSDPIPKGDFWAIWYDLEQEQFVRLNRKVTPPGWIPLNVLCNSVDLLKWLRIWQYGDSNPVLVDRALELGKAIREYEVPAYIVAGAEESLVRLIFTRVNTAGIGMKASEIFEARYGKEGVKPIRTAVARMTDMGFGTIDADLFLRCLKITCRLAANISVDSPEVVENNSISRTEKALRRAVAAIQSAGIPHWKLLPYRLPLIFLTAFYDRFYTDNSRVDRLAAKWIWHGAISGEHEEVTDAYINRLLKQTESFKKPDQALANLLATSSDTPATSYANDPSNEIDKPLSMNRASSKVFVLGLLAANPVSVAMATQQRFDFEQLEEVLSDDDEEASIEAETPGNLPKNLLVSLVGGEKLRTDVVIPVDKLKPETLLAIDVDDAILASHLLDREAVRLLNAKDIEGFRSHRKSLLKKYFVSFVEDRIGDSTDARPLIASIAEDCDFPAARKAGTQ